MAFLLRPTTTRFVSRLYSSIPNRSLASRSATRTYAHQSYGGEDMSGHPKSDRPNEKSHLEHPGPESPIDTDSTRQSSKGNNKSASPTSQSESKTASSPNSQEHKSQGQSRSPRPAINNPGPAPEDANEDVRSHNQSVAKSHDRPVNQLDEDGKVEKGFWSGNTGRS